MNALISTITEATCSYLASNTLPDRIDSLEESIDMLRGLTEFCNSRITYLVNQRDESRRVVAQHAKALRQMPVTMTLAEERIQTQKAKDARLKSNSEQKAKLLAEIKIKKEKEAESERAKEKERLDAEKAEDDMLTAAYVRFEKQENSKIDKVFDDKSTEPVAKDESGFISDTTSPKVPLNAKSAAKLAHQARSSAAVDAGSFIEHQPELITLNKCLNLFSNPAHNSSSSGVKRTSKPKDLKWSNFDSYN